MHEKLPQLRDASWREFADCPVICNPRSQNEAMLAQNWQFGGLFTVFFVLAADLRCGLSSPIRRGISRLGRG